MSQARSLFRSFGYQR